MKRILLICIALAGWAGMASPLKAGTILFTLLGDPNQSYSGEPAGPYSGYLGAHTPEDLYSFLCIDYLKTATWNTTYSGFVYGIADVVPGKTQAQLVEAAYLTSKLMWLGGSSASTSIYQGPISFAVWQIMDPAAGHVPIDAAAQSYVLEADNAFRSGAISVANFSSARIFVPDNPSIQSFLTVSAQDYSSAVPEPATAAFVAMGVVVFGIKRLRKR
jgi:hypothetical protein